MGRSNKRKLSAQVKRWKLLEPNKVTWKCSIQKNGLDGEKYDGKEVRWLVDRDGKKQVKQEYKNARQVTKESEKPNLIHG